MRNYIKILTLFFSLVYYAPYSLTQPNLGYGLTNYNTVVFMFDINHRVYNLFTNYGYSLLYQVPEDLNLRYIYNNQIYNLRLATIIGWAAQYWNDVLSPFGFQIRRANTGETSNLIFRSMSVENARTFVHELTPSALTLPPNTDLFESGHALLPDLVTDPGIFITRIRYLTVQDHRMIQGFFGRGDFRDHLVNLTYALILHEFGHALGLTHPTVAMSRLSLTPGNQADLIGRYRQVGIVRGHDDNEVPIMLQGEVNYLNLLQNQHGGNSITRGDIRASRNEREALISNLIGCYSSPTMQPHTIQFNSRFLKGSAPQCLDFKTIYPISEMMMPSIQMILLGD
ncbi:hypothetical protein ABLB84_12015 [Xenorhabdus szentirmaii]|uniref:hypothetical protein n=1 Tax=Xenorhabdus szentirmaii TaxID=290112 RepID=UPI0032B7D6A1